MASHWSPRLWAEERFAPGGTRDIPTRCRASSAGRRTSCPVGDLNTFILPPSCADETPRADELRTRGSCGMESDMIGGRMNSGLPTPQAGGTTLLACAARNATATETRT